MGKLLIVTRSVLGIILLLPCIACAATTNEVVAATALRKMSTQVTVNGVDAEAVYVGEFNHCQSVAIVRGNSIENFRVCDGMVNLRGTVSPSWGGEGGQRTLSSVLNNALYYGQAHQTDDNGYLISARTLGTVNSACLNIEVMISYDGDFVERGIQRKCQK